MISSPRTLLLCSAMFALALCFQGNVVHAQSADLEISESAVLLRAALDLERGDITPAQYQAIQIAETCQNPSSRLQARNRPYILVENTSETTDEVTSITLDLRAAGYEFGDGDQASDPMKGMLGVLSNKSDANISIDAMFGMTNNSVDTTKLVVNFTGLTPGKAAIFRFDLDPIPMVNTMFPDYQVVMLGAQNAPNSPNNPRATATTTFTSGTADPVFFEQPSSLLPLAGLLEPYHAQTMVTSYPDVPVPEPTSFLLLASSLAGLAFTRRRK